MSQIENNQHEIFFVSLFSHLSSVNFTDFTAY